LIPTVSDRHAVDLRDLLGDRVGIAFEESEYRVPEILVCRGVRGLGDLVVLLCDSLRFR
jgi:hypothetical protein